MRITGKLKTDIEQQNLNENFNDNLNRFKSDEESIKFDETFGMLKIFIPSFL